MIWSDKKKWTMDLISKLIMAIVIAIMAAGATVLIENRFKERIEKNRYRANRLEAKAKILEQSAANFLEISLAYSDAFQSAFYDVYFRMRDANNKGANQLRYENELNPKMNSLSYQVQTLCPNTKNEVVKLFEIRKNAFCFYNLYEKTASELKCKEPDNPVKESIDYTKKITETSIEIYKLTKECNEI